MATGWRRLGSFGDIVSNFLGRQELRQPPWAMRGKEFREMGAARQKERTSPPILESPQQPRPSSQILSSEKNK